MDWIKEPVFAFDVETTSLDPAKDRVVKIGIVRFEAGKQWREMEGWAAKFSTPIPMSPEAVMISGIDPYELEGKPTFEEKIGSVLNILDQGKMFLGYNVLKFDIPIIQAALDRSGLARKLPMTRKNTIDPLVFARALYDKARGWKLDQMAARLGARPRSHNAVDCAMKAADVMVRMGVRNDLPTDLLSLINLQERYLAEWAEKRKG